MSLRGDANNADSRAAQVQRLVGRDVKRANQASGFQEAGGGSIENAVTQIVTSGLRRLELIPIPVTLVILALAFGALVAASVPLLLGLTSVAAAIGALGVVSHIAPNGPATAPVVVLGIGLAVGVDYSLFYVRRERDERQAGRPGRRARGRPRQPSAGRS